MTIYDGVMGLIVLYTIVHGFWRGAAWQIAPIVSLVAGYMIAMPMSVTAAHYFGQPPLNRLFALVTIYILVSLTVYLFFRSFREGVEKAQLTEFDRHLGAILGGLKGVIVTLSATCILLIWFPPSRETILKSNSSTIASKLISTIYPVLPHAMHLILEPYLHKLGDQLPIELQDSHNAPGFERATTTTGRSQPKTVFKRVQMAGHPVIGGRLVARAVDQPPGLRATGEVGGKTIVARQGRHLRFQPTRFGHRLGNMQVAVHSVAVYAEGGDALINQAHRLQRHVPGQPGVAAAELMLNRALPTGKAGNGLSAVAPRGAAASSVGLQHHHAHTALSEFNGRRQPGEASPHHQHIGH